MEFDARTNTKELEKNLKLQDYPSDLQEKVKELVTEYRYVFCEDRLRRNIRGFSFQIYTGNHPPICCKPPRYIPHESDFMIKLVERLGGNIVVEEDDWPWRALVVLDTELYQ